LNDTDREILKYSTKTCPQCHFAHHKSHIDGPGIEPGPRHLHAGDRAI